MTTADPTFLHTAVEFSGSLLLAVTAMVVIAGLLVVALSFRASQRN